MVEDYCILTSSHQQQQNTAIYRGIRTAQDVVIQGYYYDVSRLRPQEQYVEHPFNSVRLYILSDLF